MVAEEQIEKWADDAEAGDDVEEIAALDAIAEQKNLSRSEAIRRALANFAE